MPTSDPRPNGRAARVQQAVHDAVRSLQSRTDRQDISVPRVAALAGVAPSTVYRRWGDLNQLLADVAVARLRPEGPPDTGSVHGDLTAWAEQYIEESATPTGRAFLRDMVSGGPECTSAWRGGEYARERIEMMLQRGRRRGETVPDIEDIVDLLLAPIIYRILFEPAVPPAGMARRLADRLFARNAAGWSGQAARGT
ncbi:TetR-like C-terminal domain-containing protein [Arthrobacter sp. STN4]|uniref:TetR-like C-terminal domain-containing protein n=1 Tax=Arthrobacter sp. STN4 TaxID=2923276 RepID=UPI002119CD37|nr:TetR-like C-terminal domain-containing protein [Arthrobacter sp. STN4]MCQ9164320.1 TetR/AcrR family transcriptional regulator C-terminal ligand-binding domain-containing protein [Arthrobacter sp. STN4]